MGQEVHFLNLEYFFAKIVNFFTGAGGGIYIGAGGGLGAFIRTVLPVFIVIFLGGIIYYLIRIKELQYRERQLVYDTIIDTQEIDEQNTRWARVEELFDSANESDWRLAIIEADSMLDDMITDLGFTGESLGEKLKGMEQGDFRELQSAWDAHTVRNKIAHAGMEFHLSEREKIRVKKLYERVFKEGGVI